MSPAGDMPVLTKVPCLESSDANLAVQRRPARLAVCQRLLCPRGGQRAICRRCSGCLSWDSCLCSCLLLRHYIIPPP